MRLLVQQIVLLRVHPLGSCASDRVPTRAPTRALDRATRAPTRASDRATRATKLIETKSTEHYFVFQRNSTPATQIDKIEESVNTNRQKQGIVGTVEIVKFSSVNISLIEV